MNFWGPFLGPLPGPEMGPNLGQPNYGMLVGRSSPAGHIFGSRVTAAPKTDSPAELAKKCAAAA